MPYAKTSGEISVNIVPRLEGVAKEGRFTGKTPAKHRYVLKKIYGVRKSNV